VEKLNKDIKTKFEKLNIDSFCSLALIIPSKYEDYRIHNKLNPHTSQLIDATIESVYKTQNTLQITFFSHNFGHHITGIIFKPKPYMIHQYKIQTREYYYGAIECKMGNCTINMPKKVQNIGSLTPIYKTNLRNDAMQRFIKKELTLQRLLDEGVDEKYAKEVLKLHFTDDTLTPQNIKEPNKDMLYALKYIELFTYMKALNKKRRYFKALKKIQNQYQSWLGTLPFKLTNEQLSAIEDIKKDLNQDVAAKRMIVGDVGSGKTMVILAAAFMCDKNRSILMAPTTILANQLYEEARKYLPNLNITLITNKSKKEDLDKYDFIIGTHALLYRDLPQAALVMVDEQHRFGTQQRNILEKLISFGEKKPHYLQFSATPIPRTQAMIESSYIDVTLITTTPFTKDIDSKVIHKEDFSQLITHIKDEIKQNKQILLVYPLVEQSDFLEYQSIDEARGYWENNFSDVYVTHGKDKNKEEVLKEFRDKGSILIATTVVEVGISLPRLTTVIIVGAERLGLSTLHQLRGRVSRTGLKGYCFLYTNQNSSNRLDEFVKTTSGFDIANLDLKFRKSGDLLKGDIQSGNRFKWFDFAEDEDIVKEVRRDLKLS
jgi:ATP-dependent DNA helicase RecG